MSSIEGWNNLCKKLEVKERNGRFYLKNCPNYVFESEAEAIEAAEKIKDAVLF